MTLLLNCLALTALVAMAIATSVNPTGSNAQLLQSMSQIVMENTKLKTELKKLQGEKTQLTNELATSEGKRVRLENTSQTLQEALNKTTQDKTICLSAQKACLADKASLTSQLGRCETTKKGLENDKIIHHHVLNATKTSNDQCLKDLAVMKDAKLQLDRCKAVGAIFPRSCKQWKNAGYTTNGDYIVDPDGPGGVARFTVSCEMDSHRGVPVTVMHHDSEARIHAGTSEAAYSNVRNVVYKVSLPQIAEIIKMSTYCEQFIKYECYASVISHLATWYSRDGIPMYYWGGAKPGSKKCACGMTNSCDAPGKVCNCDVNDARWRSDSGMLTDKNTLPVTKMAFGDLTPAETGYHRLGPLRCYSA